MGRGRPAGRVSLLGRTLAPSFDRRVITVAPGSALVFNGAQWLDAVVIVERGEIELESVHGARGSFASGDVLYLHGLGLRALRNRGRVSVLLSAVSRRR
jgi:hypothetical protein